MGTKKPKKVAKTERADKLLKVDEQTHTRLKIGAAKRKTSIGKLVSKLSEDV